MFSRNVLSVKPSATAVLIGKVAECQRRGIDVIKFNVGEPDFDTPEHICQEAKKAIDEGFTRYTATQGIFELREAICNKLKEDNGLEYTPENITVTVGGKQAVYNALMALCNEEDEVLIPTPCWVSYIEMVRLTGATPVLAETLEDEGFQLNIDNIKAAITDKTKVIIINTPNNPTGAVYSRESLKELADIAVEKGIYVISDEIYEKLVYEDSKHYSIASFNEDIKKLTIIVNGFAKAFAMTGWRIGYAVGEKEIIDLMIKIQGHSTTGTNSIAQKAAVVALNGPKEFLGVMVKAYDERREYLYNRLNAMKDVTCNKPTGAFYLVPNISKYFGMKLDGTILKDSFDIANYLLDEAEIGVVPGKAFEMPNNIRIAYSNSMDNIIEGMNRMEEALMKIQYQNI
jgi:aspartate aminotransferase